MNGRILKGVGGYYTVLADDGQQYTLKARGRFRRDEVTPLPGDFVEFEPQTDGSDGAMGELLERKNMLLRPRVANVDIVFAVVSAGAPDPDYLLLDKLCANAVAVGIRAVAVMNKCDVAEPELQAAFRRDYSAFTPVCCSSVTGEGIDTLSELAKGTVCCFAGQSGVGKSSIINAVMPGIQLETGDLSTKTERGRHTTRHAELLLYGDNRTMVVDTPGFSLMELPLIDPEELCYDYPEFSPYIENCKFTGCLHDSEPDCAVKQAVEQGDIPRSRWERYLVLLEQCKEKWRKRYE